MICYMKVLSTLLCFLFLHQNASASCSKGQMFNHNTKNCETCPPKLFSDKEKAYCDNCRECRKGSKVVEKCTPTSDAVCKCIDGFTPIGKKKQEICFCKIGFGINHIGKCTKCIEGFYTDKNDSRCKQWRECKSGVAIQGTNISDVVCKEASEEPPKSHTAPFQTTTISSTSTSRTTSTPKTTVSSPNNTKKDKFNSLWLVLACPGIFLLAGLLYNKRKIIHCIHNHKKVDFRKESVCSKPVEESGEKCLSLLV